MLRTRSGLPRFAARWASQVTASACAALAASLVYTVVPRPAPVETPRPELTSGGKFAARAVVPVAYDGLDTMPAPRVAPAVLAAPPPPLAELAPERRPQRAVHVAPRAEARRLPPPPVRPAAVALVTAAEPVAPARDGAGHGGGSFVPPLLPGLLPHVVSTAKAAWTLTASAGESLVDRVVPRLP